MRKNFMHSNILWPKSLKFSCCAILLFHNISETPWGRLLKKCSNLGVILGAQDSSGTRLPGHDTTLYKQKFLQLMGAQEVVSLWKDLPFR